MTDSIKIMVRAALASNMLCEQFVRRGIYLNVTVLQSASGVAAAGALCDQHPVFTTIIAPTSSQPSSNPSGQPSSAPSDPTSSNPIILHTIVTSSFIGLLSIILLIAILRFNSSMLALIMTKKEEELCHLYNILVVLNDQEEAVLENIKHKDIIFFRSTEFSDGPPHNKWTMNTTNKVFERRFEVQFYDQFDLLGQSGVDEDEMRSKHAVIGEKVVTKEVYIHKARLQVGMIISAKPAKEKSAGLYSESQMSRCSTNTHRTDSVKRMPRSSSITSMSDCGSAPSAVPIHSFARKRGSFSSNVDCIKAHTSKMEGDGWRDVDTIELSDFYSDEMWQTQGENHADDFGLKEEVYHVDTDYSGEALSIELPLSTRTSASVSRAGNIKREVRTVHRRDIAEVRHSGAAGGDGRIRHEEGLVGGVKYFTSRRQVMVGKRRSRNTPFDTVAPFTSSSSTAAAKTIKRNPASVSSILKKKAASSSPAEITLFTSPTLTLSANTSYPEVEGRDDYDEEIEEEQKRNTQSKSSGIGYGSPKARRPR